MELFQRAEMEEKINSLNLSEKAIFLFGHCNATEEICDYLTEKGFNITAILDNNQNKIGNKYKEIEISSPQNIFNYENSICLIANRHFETFKSQLLQLSYKGEIVKVVDFDTFSDFSVSENTIKEKTARMLRGKEILNEISLKYPKHFTIICPYKALGDVYWAMAFLPEYCKKHGIEKVLIAVVGKGCFEVAEMFGHKNIIMLDNAEMDEFVQAVIYEHQPNTLIAHHDKPYTDNIIKFLDKHFLHFTDYYKYAVYGLDKNANPAVPTVHEDFNEKIAKNKTVLIAPFAKSIVPPTKEFFRELLKKYHGYEIYTIVNGDEKPLDGTKPISIPLKQMISAVEYAGTFIGLRSGLCDVVNSANCNKTVLLPDKFYSTTDFKVKDFFAMPGWENVCCRRQ